MVPLVYQGRLLGKFMVYYAAPHRFEAEDVRFMQTLASTIAFAIARKRAEEALRASEQRSRLFLQNFTGIAYQMEDDPFRPVLFEGAVAGITGHPAEAFLGGDVAWPAILSPQDRSRIMARSRWLLNTPGATSDDEYRIVHESGDVRWVRDIARHIVDEEAGRRFIQGAIYDVTAAKRAEEERLEMERRLLHAQKLESLGVLAGGIAHDFNNLLLAISGNLEVAQLHLQHGPLASDRAAKFVERAMAAIHSATGLAQQMLAYSGRGHFVVRPVNISTLVQENAELLRAAIARNRELVLHLDKVPDIKADPSQIQQVIMNLITNAAEATGDSGGRIELTTGVQEVDEAYLTWGRSIETPAPGSYVYIQVEDNGSGMTADVQQRLFEPFFTTKFTGRGLGMAAVLGIVRSHHGAIVVNTAPGAGTCVQVLFPYSLAEPVPLPDAARTPPLSATAGPASTDTASEPPGEGRLVLVADDEPMVRTMCQSLLEEWGYSVLLAADGEEAVAHFRTHADRIACVILDLTMPRLDGLGALKALRQIQPDVRVILSSGYSQREAMQRFSNDDVTTFIKKPYRVEVLRQILDTIVSGMS
jgi:PAS domain S-box-containing protein